MVAWLLVSSMFVATKMQNHNVLSTMMLQWIVDSQVAESALKGKKTVEKGELEVQPKPVPSSCLDEIMLA